MVDWKKRVFGLFRLPSGKWRCLCRTLRCVFGEPRGGAGGPRGGWVFALVVFLLMDPTDAMGYALLFHWLLLPIAAFVISLRIGELVRRDGRMWLLPLALGLLYMLADFLTFRLANMLAFDKINLPQWDLFFIGAAISALGLLIGRLLGRRRSKPA